MIYDTDGVIRHKHCYTNKRQLKSYRFSQFCFLFVLPPIYTTFILHIQMSFTNNAEAGPSTSTRTNSINKPLQQPKLELVDKVEVFDSTMLEDCLDYSLLVSNNISMARDQLANERNWLTWFRLSCTLIILGNLMIHMQAK